MRSCHSRETRWPFKSSGSPTAASTSGSVRSLGALTPSRFSSITANAGWSTSTARAAARCRSTKALRRSPLCSHEYSPPTAPSASTRCHQGSTGVASTPPTCTLATRNAARRRTAIVLDAFERKPRCTRELPVFDEPAEDHFGEVVAFVVGQHGAPDPGSLDGRRPQALRVQGTRFEPCKAQLRIASQCTRQTRGLCGAHVRAQAGNEIGRYVNQLAGQLQPVVMIDVLPVRMPCECIDGLLYACASVVGRGLRRDGCARDASHSTRHRRHGGPCVQASPRATRAARRGSVAPRHVHQENASSRQGIPSPFPAPRSATERSPPRPRPVLRAGTRGRRLPRQSRHARRRASTRLHRARRPADQAIAVRLLRRARGVRPPHHPPQATHGRDVASRPDHWAGRPAAPALRGLHPGDAMVPDCPRHRLPRHRRPSAGLPRSHRGTDRGGVR
jgi:hypothetical protein